MQNSHQLIEIIIAALKCDNFQYIGALIHQVFSTPALLQVVEECASVDQRSTMFRLIMNKMYNIQTLSLQSWSGELALIQGTIIFIKESYYVQKQFADMVLSELQN